MSLADQPAFPRPASTYDQDAFDPSPEQDGMTYRQWLVGKLLEGAAHAPHTISDVVVEKALKIADVAIRAQEKS